MTKKDIIDAIKWIATKNNGVALSMDKFFEGSYLQQNIFNKAFVSSGRSQNILQSQIL